MQGTLKNIRFDYVITTVDVIQKDNVEGNEYGPDAKYVEFHGLILADPKDKDVAFLLDVKSKEENYDDDQPKQDVFTAIMVTKDTFQQRLIAKNKKFLACIHGFTVEPEKWLAVCSDIQRMSSMTEHVVIPIIWPSVNVSAKDGLLKVGRAYDKEQVIAYQAGSALSAIADIGTKISLSIMCHSMGNRVLMSYAKHAKVEKRFDDVFMVAADVWEEVFNRRIIENVWRQPPWNWFNVWQDSGLKLCNMLKDGKIHVLSFSGDKSLIASAIIENRRRRLGRLGLVIQRKKNRLHADCADVIVDVDMGKYYKQIKMIDSRFGHSYQHMEESVKYYASVMSDL